MKEWILRYAEQQNEEKSETSKGSQERDFKPKKPTAEFLNSPLKTVPISLPHLSGMSILS